VEQEEVAVFGKRGTVESHAVWSVPRLYNKDQWENSVEENCKGEGYHEFL
jgi:hypothetical protein